jgi:hypothetical protein
MDEHEQLNSPTDVAARLAPALAAQLVEIYGRRDTRIIRLDELFAELKQ